MQLALDNDFWRFSCSVYADDAVRQSCLQLQDAHGVDVNLLLFAGWLDHRQVPLTAQQMADVAKLVQPWQDDVIGPLRAARRGVTSERSLSDFRDRILQVELQAEQIEQAKLFQWAVPRLDPGSAPTRASSNISKLLSTAKVPKPIVEDAVAVLSAVMRRL